MSDLLLKKTRKIVVASIAWLAFSFYLADTSHSHYGLFGSSFDFYAIHWEVFFISAVPVWIYWAYYWINKGK